MNRLIFLAMLLPCALFSQPNNVQNEVGLKNVHQYYFKNYNDALGFDVTAVESFKPYLAYLDPNGNYTEPLFDAFSFVDTDYARDYYDGIYRKEDLDYYLNNLFVRTKVPIIREDGDGNLIATGLLEKEQSYAVLSYNLQLPNQHMGTEFTVEFDIKKHTSIIGAVENSLYYGVQFYKLNSSTNQGELIIPPGGDGTYNMSDNGWINSPSNPSDPPLPTMFDVRSFNFSIPSWANGYTYIKIRLVNRTDLIKITNCDNDSTTVEDIVYPNAIEIDNFKVFKVNDTKNLVPSDDSSFNINPNTTNWEYERRYPSNGSPASKDFLFEDRTPILKQLIAARNEILNSQSPAIILPKTKAIFVLPKIQSEYIAYIEDFPNCNPNIPSYEVDPNRIYSVYDNFGTSNQIMELDEITQYFTDQIQSKFASDPIFSQNIEIAGLYYIGEDFRNATKTSIVQPRLNHLKTNMPNTWGLFGSPFLPKLIPTKTNATECVYQGSFRNNIDTSTTFDALWQQPGAFFYTGPRGDVDRDFLEKTDALARESTLGINVESRFRDFTFGRTDFYSEKYGRIQDNFDYGYKTGYVNYTKLYYDNNGANYLNAVSGNKIERIDYDNLYAFIKNGEKGHLVNGDFENEDFHGGAIDSLHNWSGNYAIETKRFSTTKAPRYTQFQTTELNIQQDSEEIPVEAGKTYFISFQAKEYPEDGFTNSALMGANFYNNQGTELTNVTTSNFTGYSPWLSAYYLGFNTNENTFIDDHITFTAPPGATKMTFFIYRYRGVPNSIVIWKDVKIHEASLANEPDIFYTYPTQPLLTKENNIEQGVKELKLDRITHAHTSEKIPVTNGKDYKITVDVREELPILNQTKNDKALIGIEMFKADGSDFTGFVSGLSCCSSPIPGVTFHWKYIENIRGSWDTFTLDQIQFPEDVASIRIHLYNWYYDNSLYFDNLTFEFSDGPILVNNFYYKDLNEPNILQKENWNEPFPLTARWHEPVYYNKLIGTNNNTKFLFEAFMKIDDTDGNNGNTLLAVEFLDGQYNLLTDDDVLPSETNLSFSSNYKYWYGDYFDIQSKECEISPDTFTGFFNDNNDFSLGKQWYNNQWTEQGQLINIPPAAEYIRIGLHHLDFNGELRVLNPSLIAPPGFDTSGGVETGNPLLDNHSLMTIRENVVIHPNPASDLLHIDFTLPIDTKAFLTVYTIDGKVITTTTLRNQKSTVDTSLLNSGYYLLKIETGGQRIFKKLLIE